ncbi:copper-binding protein [Ancylobacter terrae]|uniref:copper-binding protein n=1 Tax=Ancylobacter sp. sgz301288 TaxID=3342077 RepID=UPI00385D2307
MKPALAAGAFAVLVTSTGAFAAGDLAIRPTKLNELVVGQGESGFGVSQKTYELETGKAYQLMIKSTGNKECAWQSPGLAQNIWLRKVEAGGIEIKAVHLTELEFEDEGEAEIFFVPVRTGTFKWYCKGMEERGMEGEFIVK